MSYSSTPSYPSVGTVGSGSISGASANGVSSAAPAYTFTNDNSSGIYLSKQAAPPEMLRYDIDEARGEPIITMFAVEDGQRVRMQLAVEPDMTAVEGFYLQLLINVVSFSSVVGSDLGTKINPLAYARRHNVARHFKLSLA